MSDDLVFALTPESERIVLTWRKNKADQFGDIIDSWLLRMQAWMLRDTMQSFDEGKQPGGVTWFHVYSDAYGAMKSLLGKTKFGIFSGALRRSFTHRKIDKTKKTSMIGSTLPYAPVVYSVFPYFTTVNRGEQHAAQLFNDLIRKHVS